MWTKSAISKSSGDIPSVNDTYVNYTSMGPCRHDGCRAAQQPPPLCWTLPVKAKADIPFKARATSGNKEAASQPISEHFVFETVRTVRCLLTTQASKTNTKTRVGQVVRVGGGHYIGRHCLWTALSWGTQEKRKR